jgi:putative phage-type endonuclease
MTIVAEKSSDTLGTARFVGLFENGSPEWHAQRLTGIGGSEVGTICGLNQWESAYTLWAKRTGKIQTEPLTSEAAEWGTRLEAVIIDKFVEKHPELVVIRNAGSWHSTVSGREWQLANPDGLYTRPDGSMGILECKTAQYEDAWDETTGEIPASYRAQVQWYLMTFGFQHATVAVLFHGNKYREFEITANSFEQAANFQLAQKFWRSLQEDTPPDWDGSASTYETVRQLQPVIDEGREVELGALGEEYYAAIAAHAVSEASVNELKSRVLHAMQDARKGLVNGEWRITRRSRKGGVPYLETKKG